MSTTLIRNQSGIELPAPGTFQIDPTHSSVEFQIRHLGLSKVRGGFEVFAGTVVIAEDPIASSVEVTLDASSFSTGNADRDGHVTSADFLDVENHPEATYRSTGVRRSGDAWVVDGDLTIKGVRRPVPLDLVFEGAGDDPWGNGRIAFSATAEINREDFGITWNQALEAGGVLLAKTVKIAIEVQAVAQA